MSQFDTDEQHKAKVKAWLDKVFAPLTPEEQVFKVVDYDNGSVFWAVFDAATGQDIMFKSESAALAFANAGGDVLAAAMAFGYQPIKRTFDPAMTEALGV